MADKNINRVVDTRIEAMSQNSTTYVVQEGASVTSYIRLPAASHSNSNTVFNLNNIADKVCRDPRMTIEVTARLTLNVNNANPGSVLAITAVNFGKKQYPVNRCVSSVQHQINQASITMQTSRLIDGLARLNAMSQDSDFYEDTQPDVVDSYANANASLLNPLAPYSNTIQGEGIFKPRTLSYTIVSGNLLSPGVGTVVVDCSFNEPLVTPFNNISKKNRRGYYAITGELINITWVSNMVQQMFAFVPPAGVTITTSSVDLTTQQCALNLIYMTPQEGYYKEIPMNSVYPYSNYQLFTLDGLGSVAPGGVLNNISTPVCNFTNVPKLILVYVKLSDSAIDTTTPDKYLALESLSCTFDSGNPRFAGASPRQLSDVSVRNGSTLPQEFFRQLVLNAPDGSPQLFGCGSVMVINPALDLLTSDGLSTASAGRYIFQATLNLRNKTNIAFSACSLYVVGISDAQLERVGSEYRNYLLTLPEDVLDMAKKLPVIDHQRYSDAGRANGFLSGAGFSLGDFMGKAMGMYDKHKDLIKGAYDLGTGIHKAIKGGIAVGGRKVRGGARAAADMFYE